MERKAPLDMTLLSNHWSLINASWSNYTYYQLWHQFGKNRRLIIYNQCDIYDQ